MTQSKLNQLQTLINRIDELEDFFKYTFNKKNKLKWYVQSYPMHLIGYGEVLDLADYPEMCEDICIVIRKHLNLMKQALEDA